MPHIHRMHATTFNAVMEYKLKLISSGYSAWESKAAHIAEATLPPISLGRIQWN